MDWTRQIDAYCERVSDAFWAEPVNALTNLVFIVVGVMALAAQGRGRAGGFALQALLGGIVAIGIGSFLAHTIGTVWAATAEAPPLAPVLLSYTLHVGFLAVALVTLPAAFAGRSVNWPVIWLSANAVVVGIGSFLFHTVAQPWAAVADTGPILMFILGYFAVAMNRFAGLAWGGAALATVAFLAGMVALSAALRYTVGPLIGGSQSYFPALLALVAIGLWLARARAHPAGIHLMRAGGVFAVSLVFRTLDGPICEVFPLGTHFLWHLLNGLVFWILLSALVRHGQAVPRHRATAAAPA